MAERGPTDDDAGDGKQENLIGAIFFDICG